MSQPAPQFLPKTLKLPAAAWIAYDLANTVYAAVLTYVFVPYLGRLLGSQSAQGIVNSLSMIAAGLLVPLFASMADHTGRARLYLVLTTLCCIVPMGLFGLPSEPVMVLGLFFLANLAYNAALVFYNSLLPSVASPQRQGLVSGLGVGLGYFGTLITLVLALMVFKDMGYTTKFAVLAGVFFLFALPSFFLVRERRVLLREPFTFSLARQQAKSVLATLRDLPRNRTMMWFLLGNFFCVDVLNTAIMFFGAFTENAFFVNTGTVDNEVWVPRATVQVFGMVMTDPADLLKLAGFSLNTLALLFGVMLGFLTDRFGSLRILRLSAFFLLLGLIGSAYWGGGDATLYIVAICGFGGLGLSGVWTAGRKLLIELSPVEKIGEYFGLYGITVKLSVIGSAVFGVVVDQVTRATGSDLQGWKVALASQAVPLALGLVFLSFVRMPKAGDRHQASGGS
ncbi:MAG: MFS transporter [Planctomycetes bacterium]|nr:MFS transporter [Planctomycetota bacterium]